MLRMGGWVGFGRMAVHLECIFVLLDGWVDKPQWLVTIFHVCEDNEESVETHNLNFPQNHG